MPSGAFENYRLTCSSGTLLFETFDEMFFEALNSNGRLAQHEEKPKPPKVRRSLRSAIPPKRTLEMFAIKERKLSLHRLRIDFQPHGFCNATRGRWFHLWQL